MFPNLEIMSNEICLHSTVIVRTITFFIFFIEDRPNTPTNLTVVEVTATSVALEWDVVETYSGEPVIAYVVHYKDETNGTYDCYKESCQPKYVVGTW